MILREPIHGDENVEIVANMTLCVIIRIIILLDILDILGISLSYCAHVENKLTVKTM